MGIALWSASGVVAFTIARIVPVGRTFGRMAELMAAVVTAIAFGLLATYLDFGGWNEPDWRAALFALFGGLAAVGITRALR